MGHTEPDPLADDERRHAHRTHRLEAIAQPARPGAANAVGRLRPAPPDPVTQLTKPKQGDRAEGRWDDHGGTRQVPRVARARTAPNEGPPRTAATRARQLRRGSTRAAQAIDRDPAARSGSWGLSCGDAGLACGVKMSTCTRQEICYALRIGSSRSHRGAHGPRDPAGLSSPAPSSVIHSSRVGVVPAGADGHTGRRARPHRRYVQARRARRPNHHRPPRRGGLIKISHPRVLTIAPRRAGLIVLDLWEDVPELQAGGKRDDSDDGQCPRSASPISGRLEAAPDLRMTERVPEVSAPVGMVQRSRDPSDPGGPRGPWHNTLDSRDDRSAYLVAFQRIEDSTAHAGVLQHEPDGSSPSVGRPERPAYLRADHH